MANVILCDRCGGITVAKASGGCVYWPKPLEAVVAGEPAPQEERLALCPDCSELLYDFLHTPDKDHRSIVKAFDPRERKETNGLPTQAETSAKALEEWEADQ